MTTATPAGARSASTIATIRSVTGGTYRITTSLPAGCSGGRARWRGTRRPAPRPTPTSAGLRTRSIRSGDRSLDVTATARPSSGGAARMLGMGALLIAAAWGLWYSLNRTTRPPIPRERTAAEFVVTWKCDQGHAIDEPGAAGAKRCATCGGEMYATLTCACTNAACGRVATMQLRYDERVLPAEMRWRPDGGWTKYVFPPMCAACGKAMRPS